MRQMASQLGVKVEALDQPLTTPQTQSSGYDNYNADPYAQPAAQANAAAAPAPMGTPAPMDGSADPYQQNMQQPATNPDGTVTVLINGEPRQVPVNPQATSRGVQPEAPGQLASPP
jgi:hypothetical protein